MLAACAAFFDSFDVSPDVSPLRCKLSVKCCQSVFRSTKAVERMVIAVTEQKPAHHVQFRLHCRMGACCGTTSAPLLNAP